MRLLYAFLSMSFLCLAMSAQNQSQILGQTQDCFAGKPIHPAQVDVYLLDPQKNPEIVRTLKEMEKQVPSGGDQNTASAFFASFERLVSVVKKASLIGHVRSDISGRFTFHDLRANSTMLLLGIAEREDDPAYYAYVSLRVEPGKNVMTLDFDKGSVCKNQPQS